MKDPGPEVRAKLEEHGLTLDDVAAIQGEPVYVKCVPDPSYVPPVGIALFVHGQDVWTGEVDVTVFLKNGGQLGFRIISGPATLIE